jgi:hypothetical protein
VGVVEGGAGVGVMVGKTKPTGTGVDAAENSPGGVGIGGIST